MFIISAIISAITCQIREQEHLKIIAEAEKMRSNLLLAVSHDLRTPLTSIIGSCSAILENYDRISQERRVQLLTDVKTDSEWLIRMVENLLSITKIQGGPAKIIKAPEIAEEIILEVVSKFKKRYSNAPIHIELPTDILVVPMDAMLIEQVLLNLLENSIRHGGNVTKIDLILRAENNFAEFKVKDNGNGISSDILPHLFDGLARTTVKNNIDSKRDMGIGLSVCNSIILAHNGNMEAYNNSDGGACFKFQIPLKEE